MRPPLPRPSGPRPAPSRTARDGGAPSPLDGALAPGDAEAPTWPPSVQAAHDRALVARLRRAGARDRAPVSLRLRVAALLAAARRSTP
jgi:hypothetical protein